MTGAAYTQMPVIQAASALPAAVGVQLERAERVVTTLLVGRLLSAGMPENLCRVRNIFATGMMLETFGDMPLGARLAVELRGGGRLEGNVVRSSSGRVAVVFLRPIELDRVLAEAKASGGAGTRQLPRAPRFHTTCPGRISSFGRTIDVTVENVSQSGAQIRSAKPPRRDTQVILSVPGLPARRCTTRWSKDDTAGLAFLEMIPFHELAAWLGHLHGHA